MDLGTIGAKIIKPANLDVSEEINACSIKITAKIDGRDENWLVMFKMRRIITQRRLNRSEEWKLVLAERFETL